MVEQCLFGQNVIYVSGSKLVNCTYDGWDGNVLEF